MKLPFLDILLSHKGKNIETSIFRKKTSTGLYTNFNSFTPVSYKIGLVKCLIFRAYKVCSSWLNFNNEINAIKEILQKNEYPAHFIDKEIKTFLDKIHTTNDTKTLKNVSYYKLPYLGHVSNQINKKLQKICNKFCTSSDIKLIFSPYKIGDFFTTKDPIPCSMKSNIVYKFSCARCNALLAKHNTISQLEF